MPSKSSQHTVRCPICGNEHVITHWYKVSGNDSPQLKRQILDGSFFVAACPHCGDKINLVPNLRYSDYGNTPPYFIYLVAKVDLHRDTEFIQGLPLLRSNGTRVHVVHSVPGIRQVITSYDEGEMPEETVIENTAEEVASMNATRKMLDDFNSAMMRGDFQHIADAINRGKKPEKKKGFFSRLFGW